MPNQYGVYGTQGIAADANEPCSREAAVAWTGSDGKFYLFGGNGRTSSELTGDLNDLWRYDPVTNRWMWLKGSNTNGQTSVCGTKGVPDDANTPGARSYAAAWTAANGILYLYGGLAAFSDLWQYDVAANQWTWINGTNSEPRVYGIKGSPNSSNTPGMRVGSPTWTGADGQLYLFGGIVPSGPSDDGGLVSDLWRCDPATGQWTWLRGPQTFAMGSYGRLGVPADTNDPPSARPMPAFWVGSDGQFYLFGGGDLANHWAYMSTGFNDLWRYNPLTNQWTWIKGSKAPIKAGTYGVQRVPDIANNPGSRGAATAQTGLNGEVYLFGGYGIDSASGDHWNEASQMNDLWRFENYHLNPASAKGWMLYDR